MRGREGKGRGEGEKLMVFKYHLSMGTDTHTHTQREREDTAAKSSPTKRLASLACEISRQIFQSRHDTT